MEKIDRSYIRKIRYAIQWAVFLIVIYSGYKFYLFTQALEQGLMPAVNRPPSVEGFMPIGALMALKLWITEGIFDPIHPAALVIFIGAILLAILLKKSFCSWICPVGALSDAVWKIGKRIFGKNFAIMKYIDYPLRSLKYILMAFFLIVILAALLSNFIFEWLIIKDFDNYVNGVKEDQFYWILASVEGSYSDGKWDTKALSESIHWAMMLGLDIKVLNADGHEVISSMEVMDSLSDTMKRRMKALFHMHMTEGKYEEYPLYIEGKNIGKLLSRPFEKDVIKEKEAVFRMRSRNFILVSFLIAGGGSLVIALFFSRYLSKPLTNLKTAAESIAKSDFNVTITPKTGDEVRRLSESFNIMAESLRKEEELRKRLMSNIAHELRTPLTITKSHIEAIEDGVIESGKGLENIKGEINRLIRLIKGIEDITTAEASFFTRGRWQKSISRNSYQNYPKN